MSTKSMKIDIDDAKIRKFQTGGPDGDLGSNEILLSRKENYVGIVDGSGVICDPQGLDKQELIRLAKERKMIEHYDKTKLFHKVMLCWLMIWMSNYQVEKLSPVVLPFYIPLEIEATIWS